MALCGRPRPWPCVAVRPEVEDLDLEAKDLGDFEVFLLTFLLEQNRSVKELNLRGNKRISTTAVRQLQQLCLVNPSIDNLCGLPIRSFTPSLEAHGPGKLMTRGLGVAVFSPFLCAS